MGTHPIFESDFDCLTDLECCLAAFCVSQPLGSFPPVWLTLISIFPILLTTELSLFQLTRMISSMLSLSKKSFVKLISTPLTPPWLRLLFGWCQCCLSGCKCSKPFAGYSGFGHC